MTCPRTIAGIFGLTLVVVSPALGQDSFMSVGVSGGDAWLVTLKTINLGDDRSAVVLGGGWSRLEGGGLELLGVHQWWYQFSNRTRGLKELYAGVGANVAFEDETRWGPRAVLGFNYIFPRPSGKWEAFAEVGPMLDIQPRTEWRLTWSIGIRWYM